MTKKRMYFIRHGVNFSHMTECAVEYGRLDAIMHFEELCEESPCVALTRPTFDERGFCIRQEVLRKQGITDTQVAHMEELSHASSY